MDNAYEELFEILGGETDEELEQDILLFINEEIGTKERDLYEYFKKISIEDVLHWLEEYEAKWNPASKIYEVIVDELQYLSLFSKNYCEH